ncbi:pH-response regulator protein [Lachnellula occidentalis]|uniref:pH-response regulator protein n=1 Tax=Lachnellula occidentalis TaxID=215460 RepID=A0A8H8UIF1_9HELO|nr:pH-response regulator protein [Lachnellula occidentalis]
MEARQIIDLAHPTVISSTTSRPHCTPFTLPSNGVLTLGLSEAITLTSDAVFSPECTGTSGDIIITNTDSSSPSTLFDLRDPFYASTIPECYALASATVIAYMLVIMLFITPRTFLHDGIVVLGRRGFTNGPSGSDAGIGIGGRPWLQKVAALTVAISLTIATADTFRVAERQYNMGIMDAAALQLEVEDGTELKVIRVISDTFLWLAQAQTLIRLFPRQREKVIIKWTAIALISLDVLFSILNTWVYNGNSRPRSFVDAVPALAYLFQLALSLLYSAWVIYYSITKRRYAFYHPEMKNICLVALLSLVAVLVPTVFFVLDISKPTLAGWGDYVRWVGAAAASVVVWEWVERIEALERNEKKDGVLGREVFDGDEMIDITPSSDVVWAQRNARRKDDEEGGSAGGAITSSNGRVWPGMSSLTSRYRLRMVAHRDDEGGIHGPERPQKAARRVPRPRPPLWPGRPAPASTPISRTDTASAESTVYAVRYHPISEATPPVRSGVSRSSSSADASNAIGTYGDVNDQVGRDIAMEPMEAASEESTEDREKASWQARNLFRRKPQIPPPEVSAHALKVQDPASIHGSSHRWDIRAKLEEFAATQAEKLREKTRPVVDAAALPVTVIPAPVRRRDLQATLEELDNADRHEQPLVSPTAPEPRPNRTSFTTPVLDNSNPSQRSQSRSQRLSDPYTPDDLSQRSTHQRGTVAFVSAGQHDRERLASIRNRPTSPVLPSSIGADRQDKAATISSRSSNNLTRTAASTTGLPVHSIPAPPRKPRSNDDD